MPSRIPKQFWNNDEPAPVAQPVSNGSQQHFQITLTPMQLALLMNCISVGATVAGRVTADAVEATIRLAKTATALRTFEREVWLSIHAKLKPFETELRQCDELDSKEHEPDDTNKDSWQ